MYGRTGISEKSSGQDGRKEADQTEYVYSSIKGRETLRGELGYYFCVWNCVMDRKIV